MSTLNAAGQYSYYLEEVSWVHHWTDRLFSFRITRPASFRFRSGEFVLLGLPGPEKPVMRAYSIASPSFGEELEFYSIKVPDGRLTSKLKMIQCGDRVFLGRKPTGTLVLDTLKPGRTLFLIGTGTGLAPFLSIVKDFEVYERFERIVLTHTVRQERDLAYRGFLDSEVYGDPVVGELATGRFNYYPTVTQEPFKYPGRITHRIRSGDLFRDLDLGRTGFDPAQDRIMICGSSSMLRETAAYLNALHMSEGSHARPGEYAIERAFVD